MDESLDEYSNLHMTSTFSCGKLLTELLYKDHFPNVRHLFNFHGSRIWSLLRTNFLVEWTVIKQFDTNSFEGYASLGFEDILTLKSFEVE